MATENTQLERVVLAFRGDGDGSFKGGHVEYFTRVLRDDGTEIARQPGRATTLSDAAAAGFTFPDVVAAINTGALLSVESQAAQIATLTADKQAADQGRTDAEAARDAALAQAQDLQAALSAYEAPVDVNGVPEWVYASQAYKALIQSGVMAYVRGVLAADTSIEGQMAQADFEKSARFYRSNATLNRFITNGTFTAEAMDDLFKLAKTFAV